ncbi:MAG: phosphoglycerol transferase I, partial [Deltaproteobacteria bacterium]
MSEVASHIGLLITYCVLFLVFYFFFIRKTSPSTHHGKRSIPAFIIIILSMITIGRGGIQIKPIAIIDAYQYGSDNFGHLILNGFFTASHYIFAGNIIERHKIYETF